MQNNSLSPVKNFWWYISPPSSPVNDELWRISPSSSPVDDAWWRISPPSSPLHYESENKEIKSNLKIKIPAKSTKFCGKMILKLKCYRRSPRILPKNGFLNRAMKLKNK